jgi:SAM-dependent methyltransferase
VAAHNWLILRLNREHVARMAPLCHGALLDVGCGEKPYEDVLGPHVDSYTGLEHPDTVHARGRVDAWGSADELPFDDGSFDTVASFHVVEHTEEPAAAIGEMARVLRPGGTLLLSVPFIWGLHEVPRDFFRFTPYGLRHLLGAAGFEEIDVQPLCGYWATASLRLSYALMRAARGPLRWPVNAALAAIQAVGRTLDRLDFVDSDAAGYAVSARLAR